MDNLTAAIALLAVLSIASERLVEIVKGVVPALDRKKSDPYYERLRHVALYVLAALAGMLTSWLVLRALKAEMKVPLKEDWWSIFLYGLMASGGSSLWNSILTYLLEVKNIKEFVAVKQRSGVQIPGIHADLNLGEEQVTSNECYDVEEV